MKKNLVLFSGFVSILLIVLNVIGTFRLCGGREYNSCMDNSYDAMMVFFPIIPLFLFSLITYPMQEKVFQAWWRFARVWIPVSMLAILVSPSYSHNFIFPIEKGTVAFSSSLFFVIISIFLLAYQSYKLRKK